MLALAKCFGLMGVRDCRYVKDSSEVMIESRREMDQRDIELMAFTINLYLWSPC